MVNIKLIRSFSPPEEIFRELFFYRRNLGSLKKMPQIWMVSKMQVQREAKFELKYNNIVPLSAKQI